MSDTDKIIAYLNRLHELSPAAVQQIVACRVQASNELESADDCPAIIGGDPGAITLGPLGMINGLLATLGLGKIAGKYDGSQLLGFVVVADAKSK